MNKKLELKNQLLELNGIIKSRKIIYIDEPIYLNIGDIAINYAALAFFKDNNYNVVASYNVYNINYSFIQKILDSHDDISIVIIGGGGFSDLYLDSVFPSQVMREKLISRFKDNQIVLLSSSIYFKDTERLETAKKIHSQNKNLELIARDNWSYQFMKEHFSNKIYLLPDMVQWLYESDYLIPLQGKGNLEFSRKDIESIKNIRIKNEFDWENIFNPADYLFMYCIRILFLSFGFFRLNSSLILTIWNRFILKKYNKSMRVINRYDCIHTDRLHGMILASLLGKKVVASDNITGKVSSYYETWYSGFDFNISLK